MANRHVIRERRIGANLFSRSETRLQSWYGVAIADDVELVPCWQILGGNGGEIDHLRITLINTRIRQASRRNNRDGCFNPEQMGWVVDQTVFAVRSGWDTFAAEQRA